MSTPRVIVGNLQFEEDLARDAGARPAPLSAAALRTISGLATLLRAFAEEGDRLWTPAPVAPERLAEVPALPHPLLVTGPLPPDAEILPWGRPGRLAHRLNHRGFALEAARALGIALPGAALLESPDDLERHVADVAAERWVVKAPLSAAGRARLFGEGSRVRSAGQAVRFFARHGAGLFEPWMDRLEDFGCSGEVEEDVRLLGVHRQLVTPGGRFRGIVLDDVPEPDRVRIEAAAEEVGQRLRAAGYRGPYGTDAWRHRDPDGRPALVPLGEANVRLTFGHLARRLRERLAPRATSFALRMGRGLPPPGVVPLLLPGAPDATSAWLDIDPSPGILRTGGEK
ncbi:MAG: DEAD/DEAH box helicase [Planctomycetota bacterium]